MRGGGRGGAAGAGRRRARRSPRPGTRPCSGTACRWAASSRSWAARRRLTGRRCRIATCRPASGPAARTAGRRRASRCSGDPAPPRSPAQPPPARARRPHLARRAGLGAVARRRSSRRRLPRGARRRGRRPRSDGRAGAARRWSPSCAAGTACGCSASPGTATTACPSRSSTPSAGTPRTRAYAFFPGYPAAIAAVGAADRREPRRRRAARHRPWPGWWRRTGWSGSPRLVPGGSRRAGLLLVALFAAAPMGVVLSMAYTEALFCALAVWALVGVLRGQWLLAGLCSAAAGLVRPTGSALALAVGLAALVAVVAAARRRAALARRAAGGLGSARLPRLRRVAHRHADRLVRHPAHRVGLAVRRGRVAGAVRRADR